MIATLGVTLEHVVSFQVVGVPRPQGSKTSKGGGRFTESSKHLPAWRRSVTAAAAVAWRNRPPLSGPVGIEACFEFPLPRRVRDSRQPGQLHCGTPDTDKLLRAVFDALGGGKHAGLVVNDDSQFHVLAAVKLWCPPGDEGATIRLYDMDTPDV